jgi:methylmalonyl-CoA mutase N-terminal domain/subunit
MGAILGGTQSLHTNSFDEALGLPTDESALLALRTQQVIAYESGVADTVDPMAGSYYVEYLTDRLEEAAQAFLARIEEMGGAVAAIEEGWMQAQIEESAYQEARRQADGESVVVGLNRYAAEDATEIPMLEVDPSLEDEQKGRLADWRSGRDNGKVTSALLKLQQEAGSSRNLLYPMRDALREGATVGEVSNRLREVFGVYRPT